MKTVFRCLSALGLMVIISGNLGAQDELSTAELKMIRKAEEARINAVQKVMGSVVAIFSEIRGGGGSGVIFDPSGLVLTNHHVVAGAGVSGWGGIADGKLYHWKLVGTDPGGDVAIIKLEGRNDFPYSPIGDSDKVRVGDWAIAMGNPFVLTEDMKPTVTLGIVSGIERYQPGSGGNQLVYGNCIQVDSSINPGNSGGPLFNMQGEIIGINGRGSFRARGRVNVGLGYAISANQLKNFIPDLMATKLVEHGTLDARFGDRKGKVVCEAFYSEGVEIVDKGLELGDELLEFEGYKIRSNDQFTNLISTLPETWPANVVFRKPDGTVHSVDVRLVGLPYKIRAPRPRPVPSKKGKGKGKKEPTPEQKRAAERSKQMAKVMTTKAGTIRDEKLNQENCSIVAAHLRRSFLANSNALSNKMLIVRDKLLNSAGGEIGDQTIHIAGDGRFRIHVNDDGISKTYLFDGKEFWKLADGIPPKKLTHLKARLTPEIIQVATCSNLMQEKPFELFGKFLIDGGDKSAGKPSFRLKTLDSQGDWFFVWATIFDDQGKLDIRLSKASPDLNADGTTGGILYSDWKSVLGIHFPFRRELVTGLKEAVQKTAVADNVQVVEQIDTKLFQVPVSEELGEE